MSEQIKALEDEVSKWKTRAFAALQLVPPDVTVGDLRTVEHELRSERDTLTAQLRTARDHLRAICELGEDVPDKEQDHRSVRVPDDMVYVAPPAFRIVWSARTALAAIDSKEWGGSAGRLRGRIAKVSAQPESTWDWDDSNQEAPIPDELLESLERVNRFIQELDREKIECSLWDRREIDELEFAAQTLRDLLSHIDKQP